MTDEPLTCRLCDSPAYICDAEHVDGRSYIHCRQFSVHSFPAPAEEGVA